MNVGPHAEDVEDIGDSHIRQSILRVLGNCLLVEANGLYHVALVAAVPEVPSLEVQVVGLLVMSVAFGNSFFLALSQPDGAL